MAIIAFSVGYITFLGCFIWAMEKPHSEWGEIILICGSVVFLGCSAFAVSSDYADLPALSREGVKP